VDIPNQGHDDFDRDITNENFGGEPSFMVLCFTEIYETFLAMMDAGFDEVQALRYLAFCSIYRGDK